MRSNERTRIISKRRHTLASFREDLIHISGVSIRYFNINISNRRLQEFLRLYYQSYYVLNNEIYIYIYIRELFFFFSIVLFLSRSNSVEMRLNLKSFYEKKEKTIKKKKTKRIKKRKIERKLFERMKTKYVRDFPDQKFLNYI